MGDPIFSDLRQWIREGTAWQEDAEPWIEYAGKVRNSEISSDEVEEEQIRAAEAEWAHQAAQDIVVLRAARKPSSPSLVQPWSYLQQLTADGAGWPSPMATAAGPQDLAGSGAQILDTYDRTPCGASSYSGSPVPVSPCS